MTFPAIALNAPQPVVAGTINRINRGKINATIDVTLTAGATTTTVIDERLAISSAIIFDPLTANAASELSAGTCYILSSNRNNGSCTITHANAGSTDRTFRLLIIG